MASAPTNAHVASVVRPAGWRGVTGGKATTHAPPSPAAAATAHMAPGCVSPTTPREAGAAGFALPGRLALLASGLALETATASGASDVGAGSARGDGDSKSGALRRRERGPRAAALHAETACCRVARRRAAAQLAPRAASALTRRAPAAAGCKRAPPRAWSEEEHAAFLHGLEQLGRGRWAELSRSYVAGRTPAQARGRPRARLSRRLCGCASPRGPTRAVAGAQAASDPCQASNNRRHAAPPDAQQVASHAQKYFLRMDAAAAKRRKAAAACVVRGTAANAAVAPAQHFFRAVAPRATAR